MIKVKGRPILEWIIKGMYQDEDRFLLICRKSHFEQGELDKRYLLSLAKHVKIVEIDPWVKRGPAFDLIQAEKYINKQEPCIVNYCDLYVLWNWELFKKELKERNPEGAIVCYTGFHPALIPDKNLFASCMRDENDHLLEIREKYCFEANKTKGYHSAGIYYFKTGELLIKYALELVDSEQMIRGEYYVSLIYNFMVKDNLTVWCPDNAKVFCNWGAPEDLEEYNSWIEIIERLEKKMNILIPMAGAGERFTKAGYKVHKPLLPVTDRKTGVEMPMVVCAVSDLPGIEEDGANVIFADRLFHKESGVEKKILAYYPKARFVTSEGLTEGQASTCLLAKEWINNNDELLISACDNGLSVDKKKFDSLKKECDIIVFTYRRNPIVIKNPNAYGWVNVDENNTVTEVSVKRAISDTPEKDHAVVATFWYKRGSVFVEAAEKMIEENDRINNEFYADQVVKHAIIMGCRAKVLEVDKYIGWGTPEDYQNYNRTLDYWKNFYHSEKMFKE